MLFKISDLEGESELHKPYSHKSVCEEYVSEHIHQDLEKQFGEIKEGYSYHFDTDAKWSLHDIVIYCLAQTGPSNLYFATYAIKEFQARLFTSLKEKGAIKEIHALLDYRNEVMAPDAYQLLTENCTKLGIIRTHAKLVVIEGESKSITIAGSANFTTNTRADVGVLTCCRKVGEYRINWIKQNIENGIVK